MTDYELADALLLELRSQPHAVRESYSRLISAARADRARRARRFYGELGITVERVADINGIVPLHNGGYRFTRAQKRNRLAHGLLAWRMRFYRNIGPAAGTISDEIDRGSYLNSAIRAGLV